MEAETLDVSLLRSEVTVAEHALASAQEDVENAVLTAPVAGVVEDVSMEAGGRLGEQGGGQQQPSITLLDPSVVEVDGSVDEIDVLAVSVGMPVAVSLSALEGQTLTGEIVENRRGVVRAVGGGDVPGYGTAGRSGRTVAARRAERGLGDRAGGACRRTVDTDVVGDGQHHLPRGPRVG